MLISNSVLVSSAVFVLNVAATTPKIISRGIITDIDGIIAALPELLGNLQNDAGNPSVLAGDLSRFFSSITLGPRPTTIEDIQAQVTKIYSTVTSSAVQNLVNFASLGLYGLIDSVFIESIGSTPTEGSDDSTNNINLIDPSTPIYPSKTGDAPYSVDETTLRAALKIPSSFTYGAKQPVLLVHGTGQTGPQNFAPNMAKLLAGTDYADPLWLNIPTKLNQDAQSKFPFPYLQIPNSNMIHSQCRVHCICNLLH